MSLNKDKCKHIGKKVADKGAAIIIPRRKGINTSLPESKPKNKEKKSIGYAPIDAKTGKDARPRKVARRICKACSRVYEPVADEVYCQRCMREFLKREI
jgi:hypothetical protein